MLIIKVAKIFEPFYKKANIDSNLFYKLLKIKQESIYQDMLGEKRLSVLEHIFGLVPFFIASFMAYALLNPIGDLLFNSALSILTLTFMFLPLMLMSMSLVIFDYSDLNILMASPIDLRIISLSRFFLLASDFITSYFALISIPVLLGFRKFGFGFSLAYLLSSFMWFFILTLLSIFAFTKASKELNKDKLRKFATRFQLAFTLIIVVSFQFIGEITQISFSTGYVSKNILFLLPTYWSNGLVNMVFEGINIFNTLGFLATFMLFIFTVFIFTKSILPNFEKNLIKSKNRVVPHKVRKERGRRIKIPFLFRNRVEEVAFFKAFAIFSNEDKFKVSAMPSIIMSIIFPFIFMYKDIRNSEISIGMIEEGSYALNFFIVFLYYVALANLVAYTQNNKASWVFDYIPTDKKDIYLGSLKALFIKTMLAPIVIHTLVTLYLRGINSIGFILFYITASILSFVSITFIKGDTRVFYKNYNSLQGEEKNKLLGFGNMIQVIFVLLPTILVYLLLDSNLRYLSILLNLIIIFALYKRFEKKQNLLSAL